MFPRFRRLSWFLQAPFPRLLHYEAAPPRILQRYLGTAKIKDSENAVVEVLSLGQIGGAFVLLGICALFAIIALIVELLVSRLCSRKAIESPIHSDA